MKLNLQLRQTNANYKNAHTRASKDAIDARHPG